MNTLSGRWMTTGIPRYRQCLAVWSPSTHLICLLRRSNPMNSFSHITPEVWSVWCLSIVIFRWTLFLCCIILIHSRSLLVQMCQTLGLHMFWTAHEIYRLIISTYSFLYWGWMNWYFKLSDKIWGHGNARYFSKLLQRTEASKLISGWHLNWGNLVVSTSWQHHVSGGLRTCSSYYCYVVGNNNDTDNF